MSSLIPYDARPFLPKRLTLNSMRKAAQSCHGCPIYRDATQAVFGEGNPHAPIVLIGEQPGNEEDLQGHPFVGPAGKLLKEILEEAGLNAADFYITNAVKHFKWEPRGKRRLHSKPTAREVGACSAWLQHELLLVRPQIVVCLGATAALSVFKKAMPVLSNRQKWLSSEACERTTITVHPSSILRTFDRESRHQAKRAMLQDLKFVQKQFSKLQSGGRLLNHPALNRKPVSQRALPPPQNSGV